MDEDDEIERLRGYLRCINEYDKQVQAVIKSHPMIKKAWDEFTAIYSLTVTDELITTANEKLNKLHFNEDAGQNSNVCPTCNLAKHRKKIIFL